MAKKIDLSGIKDFLFNHGEKVALGACAFLGVVLGIWGVWSASGAGRYPSSGKPIPEVFKERTRAITAGINQQVAPDDPNVVAAAPKLDGIGWSDFKSLHQQTPYVAIPDLNNDKRQRPRVLAILNDADSMKPKYINGLVYLYDYGFGRQNERVIKGLEAPGAAGVVQPPIGPPIKGKFNQPGPGPGIGVAGPALPFARVGQPLRMVVVHARFPMKQQMAEFQKALRMAQQDEMLMKNREDLPRPTGLDIIRVEVLPGDKVKSEVLIGYVDVKDNKIIEDKKFRINKKLEEVMRRAIYDERSPEMMKEYIWSGLTMPMPKLANRQYPKFEIPAFKLEWAMMDEDEQRPHLMAGGGPGPGIREMPGGKGPREGPAPFDFFKKKPLEKKAGPIPEPEAKEPALEYVLKDMAEKQLAESNPGLVPRVFGGKDKRVEQDVNLFHVLGQFPPEDAAVVPNPQFPAGGIAGPGGIANQGLYFSAWDVNIQQEGIGPGGVGPGGIRPKAPPIIVKGEKTTVPGPMGVGGVAGERFPDWDRDAMVRFIDVDVKPGRTYKYWVRVRMANPNHNKNMKDVAYQELTVHAELPPSDWIETEAIPIPVEYNLYAMDQQLLDDWDSGPPAKKALPPTYKPSEVYNSTPFQIHQWIEKKTDSENADALQYVIGDWVISERKMIHKGEPIGPKLTVHAPVWYEKKDIFEVPMPPKAINKKDPKAAFAAKGVQIDMLPEGSKAPVLVDFTGGKRLTNPNAASTLLEETAVDALILFPDGRLKVLNSRDASDPGRPNSTAKERVDRLTSVRARIQEVMSSTSGNGNNPAMPKEGGPKLPIPGGGKGS